MLRSPAVWGDTGYWLQSPLNSTTASLVKSVRCFWCQEPGRGGIQRDIKCILFSQLPWHMLTTTMAYSCPYGHITGEVWVYTSHMFYTFYICKFYTCQIYTCILNILLNRDFWPLAIACLCLGHVFMILKSWTFLIIFRIHRVIWKQIQRTLFVEGRGFSVRSHTRRSWKSKRLSSEGWLETFDKSVQYLSVCPSGRLTKHANLVALKS